MVDTINTILGVIGVELLILGLVLAIIIIKTKKIQYLSESFINTFIGWMIAGGVFTIATIAWDVTLLIMTFC